MPETKITLHSDYFDVAILTPSQVAGQATTLQLVMAHAICLISFPRDHSLLTPLKSFHRKNDTARKKISSRGSEDNINCSKIYRNSDGILMRFR